jgi:hypothetical protein
LARASNNTSIEAIIIKATGKAFKRISFFKEIMPLIGIYFFGKSLVYT